MSVRDPGAVTTPTPPVNRCLHQQHVNQDAPRPRTQFPFPVSEIGENLLVAIVERLYALSLFVRNESLCVRVVSILTRAQFA